MPKKKGKSQETEEKAPVEETQAAAEKEEKVQEEEKAVEEAPRKEEVSAEKKAPVEETQAAVEKEEKVQEEEKTVEEAPRKQELSAKGLEALGVVKAMTPEERTEFGVSMIKELSVLEISGWVKTLEKEFGISAAAPVAVAAAAQESSGPAEEEKKDSFTVTLVSSGDKKIQVIKEVRTITSLGLREAKALVDEAPKPVKENVTEQEANEIKAKLEAAGASVELK